MKDILLVLLSFVLGFIVGGVYLFFWVLGSGAH